MIGTNPEALKRDIDGSVKLLLADFPPTATTEEAR